VPALLPPGVNSAFDYRMEAVPAVGEHSAAILAELGWSAERIRLCTPKKRLCETCAQRMRGRPMRNRPK
jgi:crotonobetainyl-CoA:carnitine CoA-transferase CaiB-like acyl-CoA transferase